ncbi:MAG: hypothetical protein KOO62_08330 [candidate division Zixibacteria bacterium]|nr:hypothetical protein [candidate division Zixibacteria bacterium]
MRIRTKRVCYVALIPVALYLGLTMVGGGWGDKEPLPLSFTDAPRPLLLAHRGATICYPDNSLGAIEDATRLGFPGVELDIQFSADSQFFLYHDLHLTTGTGELVRTCSLTSDELQSQSLSFEGIATDQSPPMLASIMEKYGDRSLFYLDMKRYGHDNILKLAHDIAAFIEKRDLYDRAIVASAHVWFIASLEYSHPRVLTVLEGFSTDNPWLLSLIPRKFKPDFIASRQAMVSDNFACWLRETGMQERYIVYHADESTFGSTLEQGIEIFIVDYGSHLVPYLSPPINEETSVTR